MHSASSVSSFLIPLRRPARAQRYRISVGARVTSTTRHCLAACLLLTAGAAGAHVTIDGGTAVAGSTVKLAFRVGHACPGATSTTGITVRVPPGFAHAQPVPKAGWSLAVQRAPLPEPVERHGQKISEDVAEVHWTAASPAAALPGAFYDEFVLRGTVPAQAGAMWFKVLQTCDRGSADWADVPASGMSTQGLAHPAALLRVLPGDAAPAETMAMPMSMPAPAHAGASHTEHH